VNPFLVILLGLGATAAAEHQNEWRRRDQLNELRKKLGLWPIQTYFPGNIARRLQWIEQQFGLRAALWAQQAAILLGEPLYGHGTYDEARIAPFLPWLAWRLSQGDAPELVRVLEDPHHRPMVPTGEMVSEYDIEAGKYKEIPGFRELDYGNHQAWSDLSRLLDWQQEAKPDIFRFDWKQAKEAEAEWFAKSRKPYTKGKSWDVPVGTGVVWRDPVREEGAEGDWFVQWMTELDDARAALGYLGEPSHYVYYDTVYVLQDADGEPQAAVIAGDRYDNPEKFVLPHGIEFDMDPDDPILSRLAAWMRTKWDPSTWPGWEGILLAFGTATEDQMKQMLTEDPEMFSNERSAGVASRVAEDFEWFSYELRDYWGMLSNSNPGHFADLYPEIAWHQEPSKALLQWMKTGEWDHKLATQPMANPEEQLPGILRRYTHGSEDEDDVNELWQGDHDRVLPWELKVWDVYRHPSGAELAIKAQIFILYLPADIYAWHVVAKEELQFRPDPLDASTWTTTEDFDDFEFIDLVTTDRWAGRVLDEQAIKRVLHTYRSPFRGGRRTSAGSSSVPKGAGFEDVETTTSLDMALKALWERYTNSLDEIDDERVRRFFQPEDLMEPREGIEVRDILEAYELLE
jgi:hypothetical protein